MDKQKISPLYGLHSVPHILSPFTPYPLTFRRSVTPTTCCVSPYPLTFQRNSPFHSKTYMSTKLLKPLKLLKQRQRLFGRSSFFAMKTKEVNGLRRMTCGLADVPAEYRPEFSPSRGGRSLT